jgi:regulator of protease activity HflC (stomatin/prohibitin superfamily)
VADISRFGFISHLRADPTSHVLHLRKGRVAHEGAGQTFWFRSLNSSLSEVPVDDREQPLLFHGRTVDFQDVSVQATVTYRVTDPGLAARRLDFGIDPVHGRWRSTPLEQLGGLLTELAQQTALALLAQLTLTEALSVGMSSVRERIASGLRADQRLDDIGLAVIDVRVVAVRAEADVERALQTPTRELLQTEADKATYERRALAVERERSIAENELQNQIELARREEQLVAQRGQNDRRRATEEAAAAQIASEAQAGRDRLTAQVRAERGRLIADVQAETKRLVGGAAAEAERQWLAAYADLDPNVLLALAVKQLAGELPQIGTLNLTPDVLTPLVSKLSA